MCFSVEASFTGAAVVAGGGAVALREVRRRRELVLGALPLAFAAHQALEGVVWLGVERRVSPTILHVAAHGYTLFAWGLLPLWVPLAVLLVEPEHGRRGLLAAMLVVGTLMMVWLSWVALAYPVHAHAVHHSIAYRMHHQPGLAIAIVYVGVTCGSLLCSSRRWMLLLGILNLVGVAAVAWFKARDFTSVWCTYAAFASVLIILQLRLMHREPAERPN